MDIQKARVVEQGSLRDKSQVKSKQTSKKARPRSAFSGQSASTWRYTSPFLSFSKKERFDESVQTGSVKVKSQYLSIPDTRSKRGTGFGKGNRSQLANNAKYTAAVGNYDLSINLANSRKGKTFGLVLQDQPRKNVKCQSFYQLRQSPGKNKPKVSLHGRLKLFNQVEALRKLHIPGAIYNVRSKFSSRKAGFGKGNRLFLANAQTDSPGPVYNIV